MVKKILLVMLLSLCCAQLSYAQDEQEEITLTTYYPAPYGEYDGLAANRMAVGPTYTVPDEDGNLIVEGNVGVGTDAPSVKLDISGTDAIKIPAGTNTQRPAAPAAGMIRYNSDTSYFEGYSAQWAELPYIKQQLTHNGYARIGSLLIQWGVDSRKDDSEYDITFPILFPNACFSVVVNRQEKNPHKPMYAIKITPTKFSINRCADIDGWETINWIAIGY